MAYRAKNRASRAKKASKKAAKAKNKSPKTGFGQRRKLKKLASAQEFGAQKKAGAAKTIRKTNKSIKKRMKNLKRKGAHK